MFEIIGMDLCSMIICCDVDPADPDCFDKVDRLIWKVPSGVPTCWYALRPNNETFTSGSYNWEDSKPIPCANTPGRWHYVCII